MFKVNQHSGARPVDASLQLTKLVCSEGDELLVVLGWRGEAQAVDERAAAAYNAMSLEEECMMMGSFAFWAVWSCLILTG